MALTKITGEGVGTLAGDTTTLILEDTSSHSANTGPAISFKSKDSGETTREVAKIVGESHSGSNEGNLAFQTLNGGTLATKWKVFKNGNLLPSNSSYGIYLGTSSAAEANLLDDYEEGTWTPALTGLTLTTALGNYTKIGQIVHWGFRVVLPATTANTHFSVTGLPFSHSLSNDYRFGGALIYANGNIGADVTCIVVGNAVQFYKNGSSFVEYGDYNAKDVRASGAYITTD